MCDSTPPPDSKLLCPSRKDKCRWRGKLKHPSQARRLVYFVLIPLGLCTGRRQEGKFLSSLPISVNLRGISPAYGTCAVGLEPLINTFCVELMVTR